MKKLRIETLRGKDLCQLDSQISKFIVGKSVVGIERDSYQHKGAMTFLAHISYEEEVGPQRLVEG